MSNAQEAQVEAVLQKMDIDLLVLARYMQIFSEDFCLRHAKHTINIHHSFLPAFEGGICISCACLENHSTWLATLHRSTISKVPCPVLLGLMLPIQREACMHAGLPAK